MRIELLSRSRIEPTLPTASTARMPQSDPAWLDVLRDAGESADALVAIEHDVEVGWLPFTIRESAIGTVLSSQPYIAYGGPVTRDDDRVITATLFEAYRHVAREHRAVVASIGTPPMLDEAVEARWREQFAPTFVTENFAQVSSLERHPLQGLSKDRRDSMRHQIRKATDVGCRIVRNGTAAQREAWRAIYEQRYRELGAVPYPEAFHRAIFDRLLPAGKAELWLAEIDGRIVGGTLFLVDDRIVDYFASVFASEYRDRSPSYFVLDQAFTEFVARGLGTFNWESSPRSGGVIAFKAKWGGLPSRHFYYSHVLDQSILVRSAAEIVQAFPLRFVVPFAELRS